MSQAIRYVQGDATAPQAGGPAIIAHVCNDVGGWGRGFVLALSRRWPEPEEHYRIWHGEQPTTDFDLGAMQLVLVAENLWVANIIGQHDVVADQGIPPVRYWAIETGLVQLTTEAQARAASVHMPRIGCGLAGGDWAIVEAIIESTLTSSGIAVTVYDL